MLLLPGPQHLVFNHAFSFNVFQRSEQSKNNGDSAMDLFPSTVKSRISKAFVVSFSKLILIAESATAQISKLYITLMQST